MSFPSPGKLHKRSAPSQTGSDSSTSTLYSSSSTLVLEDWFLTKPAPAPSKPWAMKALSQLGLKYKKSTIFGKGKKKEEADEDEYEEPQVDPFARIPPPFVLDISREAVERMKEKELEEQEELDLLPEYPPQMFGRAPSSNVHMQLRVYRQRSQLSDLRTGSTPNLRLMSKRDSLEDPFYLETLLNEFPRPPVHNPGEYERRAPINPRMRRQNSNFSLPSSKAYPERIRKQVKHWIDRPVPSDLFNPRGLPSFTGRSDLCQPSGL